MIKRSRSFAAMGAALFAAAAITACAVSACERPRPAGRPKPPSEARPDAPGVGRELESLSAAFLESLSPEQRVKAVIQYSDLQRVDWQFIPRPWRKGMPLSEMNEPQRLAAMELLRSAVSGEGYDKAVEIMEQQVWLHQVENKTPSCCGRYGTSCAETGGCPAIFGPDRYNFTVFGKPSGSGTWGLSIEGHHLSINYVVTDGRVVASTPTAFGSDPAIMMGAGTPKLKPGTRVLMEEQELAIDLLHALSDEQRRIAVIDEQAPSAIRNAGGLQPYADAPAGLPVGKMDEKQKKMLLLLLELYAYKLPREIAAARLAEIDRAGFDKVRFAWAGSDKPGNNVYYRIQGEAFLIEFGNTQPDGAGNPANHIHTVWRDLRGDFALRNALYRTWK